MEHKGITLNCFGEGSLRVEEVFHTSKSGRLRRGWAAAQPCQWDGATPRSTARGLGSGGDAGASTGAITVTGSAVGGVRVVGIRVCDNDLDQVTAACNY